MILVAPATTTAIVAGGGWGGQKKNSSSQEAWAYFFQQHYLAYISAYNVQMPFKSPQNVNFKNIWYGFYFF